MACKEKSIRKNFRMLSGHHHVRLCFLNHAHRAAIHCFFCRFGDVCRHFDISGFSQTFIVDEKNFRAGGFTSTAANAAIFHDIFHLDHTEEFTEEDKLRYRVEKNVENELNQLKEKAQRDINHRIEQGILTEETPTVKSAAEKATQKKFFSIV